MLIIDRYIIKEWLKSLFIALMLIVGILILEDMYKNLRNFIERDASILTLLNYYAFIVPNCLHTVLPIAFFISILYTLNSMQAHNEIIALRSIGLTVFRITRSFWFIACFLMLCLSVFNAKILPYSAKQIQRLLQDIQGNSSAKGIREPFLNYYNEKDHRLWFVHHFDVYQNEGAFAMLCLFDAQGREKDRIESQRVKFEAKKQQWVFLEGKRWVFDEHTHEPVKFVPFQRLNFTCTENPEVMITLNKPVKYMDINELKIVNENVSPSNVHFLEHRVRFYSILSSPLICLMIVLLAIPFSLKTVRSNAMVGISQAVSLFFIYYIVGNIGRMLGAQGVLNPWLAAWLPNILMIVLGTFLYRQLAPQ